MRFSLRDLFSLEGAIDRGPYALIGVVGFAIKHNMDRFVASAIFHRPWGLFNYWIPLDRTVRLGSWSDGLFVMTMVLLALPFIWVGVVLTLKRLRSVGWQSWPVVFFFLPFVNLLFFVLLSVLPARDTTAAEPRPGFLRRLIPNHPVGSAAAAILLTLLIGLPSTLFATKYLLEYGWGLFVALPFCLGLSSALLYGYHAPRTARSCFLVALLSIALFGGALVALAMEGLICLAMFAPIAVPLALLGGWVGYVIQRRAWSGVPAEAMLLLIVLSIPALMGAEHAVSREPALHKVTTTLGMNAPPEVVWRNVVAFSELPPPAEWYFNAGIAYPVRAEMQGAGPGAVRHCVFSTGAFVEPIEVWDAPRRLAFSVTSTPPPMDELSPFANIKPPHLNGFFISKAGEFRLEALPGGRTRVIGSTWYQHGLWPEAYWGLWSDAIIHRIHLRVLRHIRVLAESETRTGKGEAGRD